MQQLEVLRTEHPDCIAVLVTFGAEVRVYTGCEGSSLVARGAHDIEADLIAKGQEVGAQCTEPLAAAFERLQQTTSALKPSGNTALGPALSVAVGLANAHLGSKIVLCTDGMANNGVGAIRNKEPNPFYADIARRAAEEGTSISVITMEGEDCSMENLGTCADLTGGQVEMVDLSLLGTKVGAVFAHAIVGTSVELSIVASMRAVFRDGDEAQDAVVFRRAVGNATAKTDITAELSASALAALQNEELLLQLQLRFTRPNGERVLRVHTVRRRVADREEAEAELEGTAVGLAGIHSAAKLAQVGRYRDARVHLISTCRLLQRAMRRVEHQDTYLSFIVQAEKLDGFMRERESQDAVFGASEGGQRSRDDDASRAMYQMKSLSVAEFQSRV